MKSGEMEEGDQFLLVLFIVFFFFCKLEMERVSRRFFRMIGASALPVSVYGRRSIPERRRT